MPYQTVNPFTEKLVKTFTEQTDEQLQSIITQAEDTYSNDWSKRSLADRKKILKAQLAGHECPWHEVAG